MDQKTKIKGLVAPVFTPMKVNGDITTEVIPQYVKFLKAKKLAGVFILGSSGEGVLLTTEERKTITEAWAPYTGKDFKLIVHVGSTSYRQAQELAIHARDCGASAIASMGPAFFLPKTLSDLVEFCRQIASATPELPFYYYHIPIRSGIEFSMVEFLKEGIKVIPNLAGIKFTHSNLMEMQQCINLGNGRFDIIHGKDEFLLSGLAIGVQGAIGTSYNFMPGLYQEIIKAFNEGNIKRARQLQLKSVQVFELIAKYGGGIAAGKIMMKLAGVDCGPCRAPLTNLKETEITKLNEELEAIGFNKLLSI